jgi:hypothetical protein
VLLSLLLACASPEGDDPSSTTDGGLYGYEVVWAEAPATGAVEMDLLLFVGDEPELGAAVEVEPWMPAHGHGISDPPTVEELEDGAYRCSWWCPMAGEWEIRFTVDGSAGADEGAFDVTFE